MIKHLNIQPSADDLLKITHEINLWNYDESFLTFNQLTLENEIKDFINKKEIIKSGSIDE